jgi:hypothetical protein
MLLGVLILSSCESKQDYGKVIYYTFNDSGELNRPQNYRTWIYVGTPTTPNDMNSGKAAFPEFHNVYIDPTSYNYWKENGTWKDGTILVKELVSVGGKAASSGSGYFMGEFIGLEATIKSSKQFPDEPGNWAYFSFTNPTGDLKGTAAAFKTNQCNQCHNANAADDFVFTQYYPVLTAAKGIGKGVTPENSSDRIAGSPKKQPGKWDPSAPTPKNLNLDIPVDKDELFAYLVSEKYKSFKTRESESHPSLGPHTKLGLPVKVFMNDLIANSLKAGNKEHPMGSSIVKEMFDKNNILAGWAVMMKTQAATDNGDGWFWYEVTSTKDKNAIAAMGNGVQGCIGCHTIGTDQVRTAYPLK